MGKTNKGGAFEDPGAFRQQVRMSAVQVLGLSSAELALALAYELEAVSGIPAAEADVEYRPVAEPDETVRVFDVALRTRVGSSTERDVFARWLRPAAIVGAVLLALVAADFWRLRTAESGLNRERAVRAPLDAQVRAVEQDARAKRAEAERIRQARERAARAQDAVANLRAAQCRALSVLAGACGPAAVVASLAAAEDFSLEVTGTALSASAAAGVMAAITERAAAVGWSFKPCKIETGARGTTATFSGVLAHD